MRLRKWQKTVALLACCMMPMLLSASPAAALELFSVNVDTDTLVRIDAETGVVRTVGPLGRDAGSVDLAMMDGKLYAVNLNSGNELWEIDPVTGKVLWAKTVLFKGDTLRRAEGLTAQDGDLKVSFAMKGQTEETLNFSKRVGTLLTSGEIINEKKIGATVDIDGLGSDGGELYSIHIREEKSTKINRLDLSASSAKEAFEAIGYVGAWKGGAIVYGNADLAVSDESDIYAIGPFNKRTGKIYKVVENVGTSYITLKNANGLLSGAEIAPDLPPDEEPDEDDPVENTEDSVYEVFSINATDDTLVRINVNTGAVTEVGPLGFGYDAGHVDLATMDNKLYALNSKTSNELWEINPATGEVLSSVTVRFRDKEIKRGEALACSDGQLKIAFSQRGQADTFSRHFGTLMTTGKISYVTRLGNWTDIDGLDAGKNGLFYTANIKDTGYTFIEKFYPSASDFAEVGKIRESAACSPGGLAQGNADLLVSGSDIYIIGPCNRLKNRMYKLVEGGGLFEIPISNGNDVLSGIARADISGSVTTPPPPEEDSCRFIPTIRSVRDGDWGRTSTWEGGRVPTKSDKVLISPGHTVRHLPGVVKINALCNHGTLKSSCYNSLKIIAPGGIYNHEDGLIRGFDGDGDGPYDCQRRKNPTARANSGKSVILKSSGGVIYNAGHIQGGDGLEGEPDAKGKNLHPGGHGGDVELWANRIDITEDGSILGGTGGDAEKKGGGHGGSVKLMRYGQGRLSSYFKIQGDITGGDGGSSIEARGGRGGNIKICAANVRLGFGHVHSIKNSDNPTEITRGSGGTGKFHDKDKYDGKDGKITIDPDVTDIGQNVSIKGGDIQISGGDGHLLDMSNAENTRIESTGDITLAVGDGGEVDLTGNKKQILRAAGDVNIFSDSVKLDPEKTLNDVIQADGAINKDKAKKLRDVLISADNQMVGEVGSTVPLSVMLANIGTMDDVYKVLFSGSSGWTEEKECPAGLGESTEMAVDVTVPDTAGESEIVTISASSRNDADISFTQEVEVIAVDDIQEPGSDTDGDGVPDVYDEDDDGDGMPDAWEVENMLDPVENDADEDPDDDGFSNIAEYNDGTDPGDDAHNFDTIDSDGDGVRNKDDVFVNDPTEWADADGDKIGDNADQDDDNDIMVDAWEEKYGLNPFAKDDHEDKDGDGYSNGEEYAGDADPTDSESVPQVDIYPPEPLSVIDFESDPTGGEWRDGVPVSDQFKESHGVRFRLDSDKDGFPDEYAYPTLEKAWEKSVGNKQEYDNDSGFTDKSDFKDKAHKDYVSDLGRYFLKMDGLNNNLFILYDIPVASANGQIWDIDGNDDGYELWLIEALSSSNDVLEKIESPKGTKWNKTLDAKPWTWSFNRETKDIHAIRISFIGTKKKRLGLAFDQFSPNAPAGNIRPELGVGEFQVEAPDGDIRVDYLFDGGLYEGEVGIVSLKGMDKSEVGTEDFMKEAISRVMSDSERGHIIIRDSEEGARFDGPLGASHEGNFNEGSYLGLKYFYMSPRDTFAAVLIPDGTFEEVAEMLTQNEEITDPKKRPLFSLSTANPDDETYYSQIAGVPVEGKDNSFINAVVFEDMAVENSDRDYNDIVFQIRGITVRSKTVGECVAEDIDWWTGNKVTEHINIPRPNENTPWIIVTLKSPADLLVYAPDGRVIGKDGGTIPGATFEWDEHGHQVITLPALDEGDYNIVLRAIGDGGLCHLEVQGFRGGEMLMSKEIPLTIEPHQVLRTTLPVAVFIDEQQVAFDPPEVPAAPDGTPLAFDFNGDSAIDDLDIQRIADMWGAEEGDADYDPFYDFDDNGRIGFYDIMSVSNSYYVQ